MPEINASVYIKSYLVELAMMMYITGHLQRSWRYEELCREVSGGSGASQTVHHYLQGIHSGQRVQTLIQLFLTLIPSFSIWSKLIMISAPQLSSQNSEAQAAVEDLKPKMNKFGSQCLLYHLSFCSVFDNWENTKLKYTA